MFCWPKSSHMATPARKGGWELGSAGHPGRGGDGARWAARVLPHALSLNPSADPCCSEIGAITPGRVTSSLRNQWMLWNLSPSLYPRSIPPAGLGSVLECHEQSPQSRGTEKLFSENGPAYKVAFSQKKTKNKKTRVPSEGLQWTGSMQGVNFSANVPRIARPRTRDWKWQPCAVSPLPQGHC